MSHFGARQDGASLVGRLVTRRCNAGFFSPPQLTLQRSTALAWRIYQHEAVCSRSEAYYLLPPPSSLHCLPRCRSQPTRTCHKTAHQDRAAGSAMRQRGSAFALLNTNIEPWPFPSPPKTRDAACVPATCNRCGLVSPNRIRNPLCVHPPAQRGRRRSEDKAVSCYSLVPWHWIGSSVSIGDQSESSWPKSLSTGFGVRAFHGCFANSCSSSL